MLTVVRLADNYYAAYCLETGLLVVGSLKRVATRLTSLGIKKYEIVSIFEGLEPWENADEFLFVSSLLRQAVRPIKLSRQA